MRFNRTNLKAKAMMARAKFSKARFPLRNKRVISVIPNLTTILGLCFGLSSIRFGIDHQLEIAVSCILISAVLDMMDGRLARMLNSESAIGAELDSLSDLVCFGVAPGLILYFEFLSNLGGIGWMVVLLYISSMALRLARFNVLSGEPDQPEWACKFFVGVPAPMGAYLVLSPLMFGFYSKNFSFSNEALCLILFTVSLLLVSRIPTFAIKKVTVHQKHIVPVMISSIVLIGLSIIEPWLVLSLASIGYIGLIPFSILHKKRYILR